MVRTTTLMYCFQFILHPIADHFNSNRRLSWQVRQLSRRQNLFYVGYSRATGRQRSRHRRPPCRRLSGADCRWADEEWERFRRYGQRRIRETDERRGQRGIGEGRRWRGTDGRESVRIEVKVLRKLESWISEIARKNDWNVEEDWRE